MLRKFVVSAALLQVAMGRNLQDSTDAPTEVPLSTEAPVSTQAPVSTEAPVPVSTQAPVTQTPTPTEAPEELLPIEEGVVEKVGFCSSLECPLGWNKIEAEEDIACADPAGCVEDVDKLTCCVDVRAKCTSLPGCGDGWVLKTVSAVPDSDTTVELFCEGEECDLSGADLTTCCVENAKCDTLAFEQCGNGFTHKANAAELFCAGEACTEEADKATCCESEAKCATLDCGEGFTTVAEAELIACVGLECELETDKPTCCVPLATCDTFVCGDLFSFKADVETLQCAGATCEETDREVCCDPNATCDTMKCGQGYNIIDDAAEVHCASPICDIDHDRQQCCYKPAKAGTDVHDEHAGLAIGGLVVSILTLAGLVGYILYTTGMCKGGDDSEENAEEEA